MDDHFITATVSVLLAVVGLAIVAVLVSNGAQTGSVLGQGGSAFGNIICKALAPVTGGSCSSSVSLPVGTANSTITYG